MEAKPEVEYGPPRAVNNVVRRLADTRSAAERIGFTAGIDLRTGLAGLVDWWRAAKAVDANRFVRPVPAAPAPARQLPHTPTREHVAPENVAQALRKPVG
jgi:hypothetical protein